MKKTLMIVAVAAAVFNFSAPANAGDNDWLAPVMGGVAGGFIGNQFGKGTGNTIATAVGAVGGVLLGQNVVRQNQAQSVVVPNGIDPCGGYTNLGARAACARGIADRQLQAQINLERQAYLAASGGSRSNNINVNGTVSSDWGRTKVTW